MEALVLHEVHARNGARFGGMAERELVTAFSTPALEDQAARTGTALVDASFRDLLRITGEDRVRFLQGMLTQDVLGLAVGAAAPAAFCTPKGALVTVGEIVRRAEELWFDLEPGMGAPVKAALEKYLISDDAEISDARGEWALLELWGPGAGALAPRVGGAVTVPTCMGALPGQRLFVPRQQLADAWKTLAVGGATAAGFEAREVWRIEAGLARFGQDMDDTTLPLEANLEPAISYTKGCYVGQEVVARATYRGHVNWKLGGVSLGSELLPAGTALVRGGKQVGHLTSVARSARFNEAIGLARLHRDVLEPGTPLDAGGRTVTVRALPFA